MVRSVVWLVLSVVFLLYISPAEAGTALFTIGHREYMIDGKIGFMDVAPYIEDGRAFMPVRYAALATGVEESNIIWDGVSRTVTLLKGDRVVQMTIGSKTMIVNGVIVTMDTEAKIRNGRVVVPLRWIAQSLGVGISWDSSTQTIVLTNKEVSIKPEAPPSVTPPIPQNTQRAPAENPPRITYQITGPLSLIADDGKYTYLGKLTTNKFDPDSIFNEFGRYGSKFSSTSIWNKFGTYGSPFSSFSPFNEFSVSPPMIIDGNHNIVGRLTVNKFVPGAISPYEIYGALLVLGF
jgi:hypothetical protein